MAGAVKRVSSDRHSAGAPAVCEVQQLENRVLLSGSGVESKAAPLSTSSVTTRARVPGDAAGKNTASARNLGNLGRRRTVRDFVGSRDKRDWYHFRTYEGQNIDLRLSGKSSAVSMELFFDANANGRADSGESAAPVVQDGTVRRRITLTDVSKGHWYLLVSQNKGRNNYSLTHHGVDDDRLADANSLGAIPATFTGGQVGFGDPEDFHRFTVATRQDVTIELTNLSADVDLEIVRDINNNGRVEDDEVLAESSLEGTDSEIITLRLDAGTYFARVIPVKNVFATYDLSVSNITPGVVTTTDWGIITDVDDTEVTGTINDGDSHVYTFEIENDQSVSILLTDLTDEADLRFYEDAPFDIANLLGESTNFGLADETITLDLEPGIYFIVVDGLVAAPGTDYTLEFDITPVVGP